MSQLKPAESSWSEEKAELGLWLGINDFSKTEAKPKQVVKVTVISAKHPPCDRPIIRWLKQLKQADAQPEPAL